MLIYNAKLARRLANHDEELFEKWVAIREEFKTNGLDDPYYNASLVILWNDHIARSTKYDKLISELTDIPKVDYRGTNVKAIEAIIKEYGWNGLIDGLEHYAQNMSNRFDRIGLKTEAEKWGKVKAKISAISKNVQL